MKKILRNIFLKPTFYAMALVVGYLAMSTATTKEASCNADPAATCKEAAEYTCVKPGFPVQIDYCDPLDHCPS